MFSFKAQQRKSKHFVTKTYLPESINIRYFQALLSRMFCLIFIKAYFII